MSEEQRKNIIHLTSGRILSNLEKMGGYSKVVIIQKLLGMCNDQHLQALFFALDLLAEPEKKDQKA
ncbi:MAG TPA: hypothetical protein VEL31_05445 [Ktedonobacteraceae bacterium]|nr:hypothetical protein [Ktedonobacteraceae bacterium]